MVEGKDSSKSISLVGATVHDNETVIKIKPSNKGDNEVDLKVFHCYIACDRELTNFV